jgi:acyl-CoA dehydrogenase
MAQAYVRLTAMKLFAYRALDYVRAATADDRRYLLFTAVQKARVSTEGVKVVNLISECIGAKGFESDTYIEMALRDAALIPSLEGSAHINLALAAQFIPQYFGASDSSPPEPKSLIAGEAARGENSYLMNAHAGKIGEITFADFLRSYQPLMSVVNLQIFSEQARGFRELAISLAAAGAETKDQSVDLALGQCTATIAYAQLVAENAARLEISTSMIAVIFHFLVQDLTASMLALSSLPGVKPAAAPLISIPRTSSADWDFVFARLAEYRDDRARG